MKKFIKSSIISLIITFSMFNYLFSLENIEVANKEFVEKISQIVKNESEKAFNKYNNTKLLTAKDLTDEIIPAITKEVIKKSLPLILNKKLKDDSKDNYIIVEVDSIPIRVNDIKYEYERMPKLIQKQIKNFHNFIVYLDNILIVKKLFLEQIDKLKLRQNKTVKYQLKVAFENLLVEEFIKNKQLKIKEELNKKISEKEMRDFYRDNLEKFFQIPSRVTLSAIIKKCNFNDEKSRKSALEQIEKAYKDLESGVSFEKIQEKYSDVKKRVFGKFIKNKTYDNPPINVGLKLLEGKYSEVIQGNNGFYIVLPIEIEKPHTIPFQNVKKTIISTLVGQKTAEELNKWIKSLRNKHKITIFEENLKKKVTILKPDLKPHPIVKKEKKSKKDKKKKIKIRKAKINKKVKSEDNILAKIDDMIITKKDLNNYLEQLPDNLATKATTTDGKLKILNRLIDKKVVLLEAKKDEFEYNKDFITAYTALENKILSKNLVIKEVASKIKVKNREIEKYFKKHNIEVKARHILFSLPPDASKEMEKKVMEKAKAVLKKAKANEDFATLAKTYSDDPSRTDGGYLGYFTYDTMVEPFSKAAFKMKPGEISGLVRTVYGYHIIKVEDRRRVTLTPELRAHIKNDILLPQKQKKRFKKYVDKLKKRAKIKYYEDNIRKLLKRGIMGK